MESGGHEAKNDSHFLGQNCSGMRSIFVMVQRKLSNAITSSLNYPEWSRHMTYKGQK